MDHLVEDSDVVFFVQPEFFNDATLIEVGRKTYEGMYRKGVSVTRSGR